MFISDGLFYTGTLRKLIGLANGGADPVADLDQHRMLLKGAQRLILSTSATDSWPVTRHEIEAWLLRESRVLEPRVRKQLNTDIDPIVSFVESVQPEHRQELSKP